MRDYQVAIAIQCALFCQCVTDNDDIVEHLTQLKKQWEQLNVLDNEDFHVTNIQFKTIIVSSLPLSLWKNDVQMWADKFMVVNGYK